ncbi:PIN domain-containing protein [Syncephalis fuscata]|nr:PIN domain-containing protein [Syncephalis fuscata]
MSSSRSIWSSAKEGANGRSTTARRTTPSGTTFRLSAAKTSIATPNSTSQNQTTVTTTATATRTTTISPIQPIAHTNASNYNQNNQMDDNDMIDWMDVDVVDPEELARIATMVQELRNNPSSVWTPSLDTLAQTINKSSQTSIWASGSTTSTTKVNSDYKLSYHASYISKIPGRSAQTFRLDGQPVITNCFHSNNTHHLHSDTSSINTNIMAMDRDDVPNLSSPLSPPPPIEAISSSNQVKSFVVVDTNVFISHLCYLTDLLESLRAMSAQLVVPWVVSQELDHLKTRTIRTRVTKAIHFIHDALGRGDPGLRGQKNNEFIQKFNVNDDTILDCAQYFATQNAACPVLLLSNDYNLRVKAMIHDLCVWNCDEGGPDRLVAYLSANQPSNSTVHHNTVD